MRKKAAEKESVKDKIEREERPGWCVCVCVERSAAQKSSLKGIFSHFSKSNPIDTSLLLLYDNFNQQFVFK